MPLFAPLVLPESCRRALAVNRNDFPATVVNAKSGVLLIVICDRRKV